MREVQEIIEGRELIVLDACDVVVRGTYHRPHDSNPPLQGDSITRDRVGVLFLNGLYATRAANGDSAVYWADSFAECGYPSFRIDLPGFGDSQGDPPADGLGFINGGGYASITAFKINELVGRFQLSGIVMVGHCAGAVSAIYAAGAAKECKGLVLMEPYFYLPQTEIPKVRKHLNIWARKSRFGGLFSRFFDLLKHIRLVLRGRHPPANANFFLLRRWKEVTSEGLPTLVIKAPSRGAHGIKPRVGEFDYLKHALELTGQRGRVVVEVMDGANHSFSNRLGRETVREHVERWLEINFPLNGRKEACVIAPDSEPDYNTAVSPTSFAGTDSLSRRK